MPTMINIACHSCKVEYTRTVKQINVVIKRSGVWTCAACASSLSNKSRAKPVGSTRVHTKTGYIEERTDSGWKRQHILVVERSLGRALSQDEVVHHINENKADNALENLSVMKSSDHTALHHSGAKRTEDQKRRIKTAIRLSSRTKMTDELAAYARDLVRGGAAQCVVAKELGVSKMTISRIVRNQSWS